MNEKEKTKMWYDFAHLPRHKQESVCKKLNLLNILSAQEIFELLFEHCKKDKSLPYLWEVVAEYSHRNRANNPYNIQIKKKKNDAFTLVEIMIVVAIIGLLCAIAIPNFITARKTAQMNICI